MATYEICCLISRGLVRYKLSLNYHTRRASCSTLASRIGCNNKLINAQSLAQWSNGRQATTTIYSNITYRALSVSCLNWTAKKVERFILPDIGEGIKEVTIKEWQIKIGDVVSEFDPICEVESDKATVTISSKFNGKITKIYHELGSMAQVGQPLVDIEVAAGAESRSPTSIDTGNKSELVDRDQQQQRQAQRDTVKHMVNSTAAISPEHNTACLPSVRRLAKENSVDLAKVKPSGKFERILKEDVLAYLADQAANLSSGRARQSVPPAPEASRASNELRVTRVPMRSVQKAMYKSMTAALQVPHFNYSDEIDVTRMTSYLRERKNLQQKASSSSFAFFVKMVSLALLEYPELNASIDADNNEQLVLKHYHNIGIAVDTRHGLVVPNIKHVESKSVSEIFDELTRLRQMAYDAKLSPSDLSGGTMSLSNIGAIGGVFGVPVLVTPEIIIGALGKTRQLPRFNNQGQIEARQIMQVVWSADHRVVDGATLSRFSNLLKSLLETPESAIERMT